MNRRPPGLSLSKALVGFGQYKAAEGLSPRTLVSYTQHLRLLLEYAGDGEISQLTRQDISAFLAWLRTEYIPRRVSGDDSPLSPKTIRNIWITLCSFFSWASAEFDVANPMKGIPAPRFEKASVEPFTKEQVESLLKVCQFSREAKTTDRRRFVMRRPTARRDCAIVLTLLDTSLRATELCCLRIEDVDLKTGRVEVKHGSAGGAKFKKGRVVFLGKAARRAVWRYLAEREDGEDEDAPLFLGKFDRPMNKDVLRRLIARLGEKANVPNCHPHRFRHTFAITYLRAGGGQHHQSRHHLRFFHAADSTGVAVGVGEGTDVAVGRGVSVGVGEGTDVAVGRGVAVGVGEGTDVAVGRGVGEATSVAVGSGVRVGQITGVGMGIRGSQSTCPT